MRRELERRKKYGADRVVRNFKPEEPVSTEIIPGKKYTKTELGAIADQLLRDQARTEVCRECGGSGTPTGEIKEETFTNVVDGQGHELAVEFEELQCDNDHQWFSGEGKERGIAGENPVLFEEHFHSRRRREIYTSIGTPDPSIVAGIYNRTHPQGRKVNSPEQRRTNGASYYR